MLVVVLCLTLANGIGAVAPAPQDRQTGESASVSGRLVTEDHKPLVSGTVILSRTRRVHTPDRSAGEATVLPDGSFTFHDVPPGDYVIRARARTERDGVSLFATFTLRVGSRDVEHVELMLQPGAVVQGQVVVEARHRNAPPSFPSLRVRAPLPNGSSFGDARGAAVRRDGTFSLQGVMAGTHVLVVQGLAFPWRIVDARIRGQNALEHAFDVEARQQVRGVRVVLSDTAAGIAGTVSVRGGASLADVLVVAFPADPLRRALPLRFVRVGRPASDGSYRLVDLPADDYRVIAALHATEQDAFDPDVLERWMRTSAAITLAEARVSILPLTAGANAATASVR